MIMLNAYAYRSTNPKALKEIAQCEENYFNDFYIHKWCGLAKKVVVCWGAHVNDGNMHRQDTLLWILKTLRVKPYCFAINKDGTPKHPLYCRNDTPLIPYMTRKI